MDYQIVGSFLLWIEKKDQTMQLMALIKNLRRLIGHYSHIPRMKLLFDLVHFTHWKIWDFHLEKHLGNISIFENVEVHLIFNDNTLTTIWKKNK